jgi:hypothetical protein
VDLRAAVGRAVITICVTGIALVGCGQWQDFRERSNSGIEGQTVVDGGCAVTVSPTPCADRPLMAYIRVFNQDRAREVTSIKTASDGTFRAALLPGTYLLHPTNASGGSLPTAEDLSVTVQKDQFVSVKIIFDSGVR